MRYKIIIGLSLSLLLIGCNGKSSTSSTSNTSLNSSEYSSIELSDSSSSIVSEESSVATSSNDIFSSQISSEVSSLDSSSIQDNNYITSIKECKEKAKQLSSVVNDKNVAESDLMVNIKAKVLARFDAITTKSGYGNRYKILVANDEGYIYLKVDDKIYSKLENKIGNYFDIIGKLSLYCGEVELTVNDMPSEISHKDDQYENLYINKSLRQIYDHLSSISLNSKGCGYSSLVKFTGKYLATMDDVVLLFSDGDNIIQVHGPKKFKNSLSVGSVYDIYGAMNMYNFKPGIEYVYSKINNQVSISDVDKSKLDTIDNQNLYSIKYETDKNSSYPSYSKQFEELRIYRGYANIYQKGYKYYVVLKDTYKDVGYDTYTNARDDKALFVKNESCVGLIDFTFCPFYDFILEDVYIEVVVAPYLWNTNKYWQVYALEDLISVISNI